MTEESNTESTQTTESNGENNTNDLGYDNDVQESDKGNEKDFLTPDDGNEKETEDKVETNTGYEKDKETEEDVTGYTKDDKENEEDKQAEDKEKDKQTEETEEFKPEEIKEIVETLPEGFNKESIETFVKDNKITKDQLKAYVEFEKKETQRILAEQKLNVENTRKQWKKELMEDKDFGGEFFDKNVKEVGKVFDKYMPETKKMLTERGSVVPPYIMKDLLKISKAMNPKEPLVNGQPSKSKSDNDPYSFLNELYE